MSSKAEETFDRVSTTAQFVAYWRQYTDIPFALDVAVYINANETIETFLRDNHVAPGEVSWYAPLFEVRYKSIQEAVRRFGLQQVVELASGFSLRGLSLTRDPGITYIETDLRGLTDEKAALVSGLRQKYGLSDYGNFHMSAADALDPGQLMFAARLLRDDRPAAVVSEGLFPYLTVREMETVVINIKTLLARYGGVWITPDFLLKGDGTRTFQQRRQVGDAIAQLTGRRLHSTMFDSEQQLFSFFERFGLQAGVLNQADLAPDIVSLKALNLPQDIIEKARPKLNLWVLTLSNTAKP